MQNYVLIFFCECFCTSSCILETSFKKPTILPEIVEFFKFVGEMQELLRKRPQKNNKDVILNYISLPIYPLLFPKFYPMQKQ